MSADNLLHLPASTKFNVEQAMASAAQVSLNDVIVIGYDQDGSLFIRSSRMTCAEAVFLCEKAKGWALSGGDS